MSSHIHRDLHSSSYPIVVTLVLIVVALVYLRGWHQLRNALPHLVSVGGLRRSVVAPLLQCWPAHSVGRLLTHPAFCWIASTVTVIGWHVPALFELGMQSEGWHRVEHANFLAAVRCAFGIAYVL